MRHETKKKKKEGGEGEGRPGMDRVGRINSLVN